MVMHEFRCPQHGAFEALLPMGVIPLQTPCPRCGSAAPRQMSAPRVVRSSHSKWLGAVERADKSRHEPEVVDAVPPDGAPRRIRQAPWTPLLQRLPRP